MILYHQCRRMLPAFLMLMISCGPSAFGRPRPPMPPLPEMAPVLWQEHFDQPFPYDIDDPSTLGIEDFGELVESWSGYGLGRSGVLLPACTLPGLDAQGRALINPGSGAARLWISPSWSSSSIKKGTGPGDLGCLLELSATDGRSVPVVCWSLVINPDGTRISLVADSDGGAVELLGAPIQWTAGEAHFVALNFGTNATALYLDGQLAVQGAGTIALPASVARLTFGSASTGTEAVQAVIDELYSFRRPLTAADVAFYYTGNASQAALGPITVEEDLARAQRVLAFKSRPLGTVQSDAMLLETLEEGGGSAYEEGTLWIEITGATSNDVSVVVHGTQVDMVYELLSKTNLADTIWVSEGEPFLGQDGQTATTVTPGERTNSLFLRARSWLDSEGSGMPDWWQLQWFGQTGVDPYGDDDQDGWVNLQEYQNGSSPTNYNTPPAPQGLKVTSTQTTNIFIRWLPSALPASGYELEKDDPIEGTTSIQLPGTATEFSDTLFPRELDYSSAKFRARSLHGTMGPSEWSSWANVLSEKSSAYCTLVRDVSGRTVILMAGYIPAVTKIRLTRENTAYYPPEYDVFEIPLSSFTNGLCPLPEAWISEVPDAFWHIQGLTEEGEGVPIRYLSVPRFPVYDGRQALYQNLVFQMRAANAESAFGFGMVNGTYGNATWWLLNSPDYAYAAFRPVDVTGYDPLGYRALELHPFFINYLYRNWAYDPAHIDSTLGRLTTGASIDEAGNTALHYPGAFEMPIPSGLEPPSCVLAAEDTEWTSYRPVASYDGSFLQALGLDHVGTNLVMAQSARNLFGLTNREVKLVWGTLPGEQLTIHPGDVVPYKAGGLYPKVDEPILEPAGYYFRINSATGVPGGLDFSVTNETPLLVATLGEACCVAGYSRQRIVNGAQDKPGYLEQYFEGAFTIGPDGLPTTNRAGVLSKLGDFVPLVPGPAALITEPDYHSPVQGTATVHVISMAVDRNHDGIMDLSFTGDDATFWQRPFRFWINNDRDTQSGTDKPSFGFPNWDNGMIDWQRDLEDFARLWICGIPALSSSAGYQVTLSWNVLSGNPAINLFRSCETNGGTGYLTDTNVAAAQTVFTLPDGAGLVFGQVRPDAPFTFPASYFANTSNKYLLFEGAGIGSGELVLTVKQNGQTIAQTSAWLDLRDIKSMYQRVRVTPRDPNGIPSPWTSTTTFDENSASVETDGDGDGFNPPTDEEKTVTVFVHGSNLSVPAAIENAETMFKRLYWQGYRGRFALFYWNTLVGPWDGAIPAHYNYNEFRAFKYGQALKKYVENDLPANYVKNVVGHSMGNMVIASALYPRGSTPGMTCRNVILMQAAVPASCFDPEAVALAELASLENPQQTPDDFANQWGYRGLVATNINATLYNIYNAQDYALGWWITNQKMTKPEDLLHPIPRFAYLYRWSSAAGGSLWNWVIDPDLAYVLGDQIRTVTDPQESIAFLARSRTEAVGRVATGGSINITRNFDVGESSSTGLGRERPDHSGEFARPIQQLNPFYAFIYDVITRP